MAARTFVAASILIVGLAMSLVDSSGGNKPNSQLLRYPSFIGLLRSPEILFFRDALSGTLWCAAAATFFCILLIESPIKPEAPLLFLAVIVAIASRFGAAAGSVGTMMAALIFAEFLFEPVHKLAVSNPVARSDLAWMIMGGLAISALFGKPRKTTRNGATQQ